MNGLPKFATRPVAIVVAAQIAVLTAFSSRYGFHRDELYFLAAGDHLDWGYVDHPPITPVLAKIATAIFGETPFGMRVVATLAAAATTILIALVARELGGNRTAQWASAAATAVSVYVVVVTHMLSTTTIDMLIWVALGLVVLRLLRTGDGRWWLAVGAVIGIGMANKWLVLMLVSGLAIGVFTVGPRKVLRSGWLWAGVAVTLVLTAPIMVWQVAHDFPQLTVASGISEDDGAENRIMFVPMQIAYLSFLAPVWIAGLVRLWRDPELRWARALAVSYPVVCVELLVLGGKPYYSAPVLMLLVAAGMPSLLRWLNAGSLAVRRVLFGVAGAVGVAMAVLIGLPSLPPSSLNGFVLAVNKEQGEQVGWQHFALTVSHAWDEIPEADRDKAVIFTANYGQAGAIQHHGKMYGLPTPYSGHMSYADWGPPPDSMTGPVLFVGRVPQGGPFTSCRPAAQHDNGIGLDNEEQDTMMWVCTGPREPWSRAWPGLRHFY